MFYFSTGTRIWDTSGTYTPIVPSVPWEEAGAISDPRLEKVSPDNLSLARQSLEVKFPANEATKVYFSRSEEGCTKTYQSFTSLQKKLNAGKHLMSLERGTNYDHQEKKGWKTQRGVG